MQRVKGFVLAALVHAASACSGSSAPVANGPVAPLPPEAPADGGTSGNATREACQTLMAHVVDLAVAEHKDATLDDRDQVRKSLGAFVEQCQQETAETVRCGTAAANLDDLAACQPARDPGGQSDQRTRSNSTSNSSVAPPGITPAAPRSP